MEINGLPAHVLLIHAAVMFVPLSAAASILYAAFPRWRWASRYPMVVITLIALGAVIAAYLSGKNFKDKLFGDQEPSTVSLHEERAQVLLWTMVVFAVVVLIAAWGLGGPSALVSTWGLKARHNPLIERSLVAMVVMLAITVIALVIATGDAGSRAVWEDVWESVK